MTSRARWSRWSRLPLLFVLALFPAIARAQSANSSQEEILEVFRAYTSAVKRGDVTQALSHFHSNHLRWNLAQERPRDLEQLRQAFVSYLKSHTVVEYEITPLAIQVTDYAAVALVRYRETVKDSANAIRVNAGAWSATFVRDRGSWLLLSSSFVLDSALIRSPTSPRAPR